MKVPATEMGQWDGVGAVLGAHALPMGWQTVLPRILGHLLVRDSASLS